MRRTASPILLRPESAPPETLVIHVVGRRSQVVTAMISAKVIRCSQADGFASRPRARTRRRKSPSCGGRWRTWPPSGLTSLVVWKSDRIERRGAYALMGLTAEATKAGGRIEFVTEPALNNASDPIAGPMLQAFYGAMGHHESKTKSDRTSLGHRQRRGHWRNIRESEVERNTCFRRALLGGFESAALGRRIASERFLALAVMVVTGPIIARPISGLPAATLRRLDTARVAASGHWLQRRFAGQEAAQRSRLSAPSTVWITGGPLTGNPRMLDTVVRSTC